MSIRLEVLLWAQRVVARKGAPPHQLLEIDPDADLPAAQDAFHKIARVAHPDLHRNSLTEEELELLTTADARVAAAYQDLRNLTAQSGRLPALRDDPPPPRPRSPSMNPLGMRLRTPSAGPPLADRPRTASGGMPPL